MDISTHLPRWREDSYAQYHQRGPAEGDGLICVLAVCSYRASITLANLA